MVSFSFLVFGDALGCSNEHLPVMKSYDALPGTQAIGMEG
jgi:hypothetical protein